MLSKVIDSEAIEKQKLRIFLSMCGLYKRETLNLNENLYKQMLEYISFEPEVTRNQAIGFLRAAFQNNIGLTQCPLKTLLEFDRKFSLHFDSIYHCLLGQFNYS
jgi:hypothetical protein